MVKCTPANMPRFISTNLHALAQASERIHVWPSQHRRSTVGHKGIWGSGIVFLGTSGAPTNGAHVVMIDALSKRAATFRGQLHILHVHDQIHDQSAS